MNLKFKISNLKLNSGQSLIEILVTISIGALVIGGAVMAISVALRSNSANVGSSFAAPLAKGLIEKVRVVAEGDWNDIYNLAENSPYFLDDDLTLTDGEEDVDDGSGRIYTRSFIVTNVSRDNYGSGIIDGTAGNLLDDPSTQKVEVTVSWGASSSLKIAEYLTRSKNDVNRVTGWPDGSFDSQNGIDFSTSGAIELSE